MAKKLHTIELYRSRSDKQWRSRLRAANGKIVLPQEGHASPSKAKRALRAASAGLVEALQEGRVTILR